MILLMCFTKPNIFNMLVVQNGCETITNGGEDMISIKKHSAKKRGLIIIVACFVLLTSITAISTPKNSIHLMLSLYSNEFEALALRYLNQEERTSGNLHGITVDGVMKGSREDIVQFSTYGLGTDSIREYHGFYYSPGDYPAVFRNMNYPLTKVSEGKWNWADGTGNYGSTTYISPHFYYYEAYF